MECQKASLTEVFNQKKSKAYKIGLQLVNCFCNLETHLNSEFKPIISDCSSGYNNTVEDNCSNDSEPFFTGQDVEYDSNEELILQSYELSPIK